MAAAFEQYRLKLEKALNEKNAFTDVLATIEEKTGVKRIYIVGGVIAVIALWLIFGYAAAFLSTFLGFVYPAYMSVKAIESERKDDDTQWLTYWVVFGVFSLGEFFTDIFLSWFPFYYLFKMIFLTWCMAPIESNGANMLYHRAIKPFVLKHEREIDDSLGKVTDIASSTLNEGEDDGTVLEKEGAINNGDSDTRFISDYNAGLLEVEKEPHDESLICPEGSYEWFGLDQSVGSIEGVVSNEASSDVKEEPPPNEGGGSYLVSVEIPHEGVSKVGSSDTEHLSGRMPEVEECPSLVVEAVDATPPHCASQSEVDEEQLVSDAKKDSRDDVCVDDGYTSSDEGDARYPDSSLEDALCFEEPNKEGSMLPVGEPSETLPSGEREVSCTDDRREEMAYPHGEENNNSIEKVVTMGSNQECERGRVDNSVETDKMESETECHGIQEEKEEKDEKDNKGVKEKTKGSFEGDVSEVGLTRDDCKEDGVNTGISKERKDVVQTRSDKRSTDAEVEVMEEFSHKMKETDSLKSDVVGLEGDESPTGIMAGLNQTSRDPQSQSEDNVSCKTVEDEKQVGAPENVKSPILQEQDVSDKMLNENTFVSEFVATEHRENVGHEMHGLVSELNEDEINVSGEDDANILPVSLGQAHSEDLALVDRSRDVREPLENDESGVSNDLMLRSIDDRSEKERVDECSQKADTSTSVECSTVQHTQARLDEVMDRADSKSVGVEISNDQVGSVREEVEKTDADSVSKYFGGESEDGEETHDDDVVDEVGDVGLHVGDVDFGSDVGDSHVIGESGSVDESENFDEGMRLDLGDEDTGRGIGESGDNTKTGNVDEVGVVKESRSQDVGVSEVVEDVEGSDDADEGEEGVESGNFDGNVGIGDSEDINKTGNVDEVGSVKESGSHQDGRVVEARRNAEYSDNEEEDEEVGDSQDHPVRGELDSVGSIQEGKGLDDRDEDNNGDEDDSQDDNNSMKVDVDKGRNVTDSKGVDDVSDEGGGRGEDGLHSVDDDDICGDFMEAGNVDKRGNAEETKIQDNFPNVDVHRGVDDSQTFVEIGSQDVSESGNVGKRENVKDGSVDDDSDEDGKRDEDNIHSVDEEDEQLSLQGDDKVTKLDREKNVDTAGSEWCLTLQYNSETEIEEDKVLAISPEEGKDNVISERDQISNKGINKDLDKVETEEIGPTEMEKCLSTEKGTDHGETISMPCHLGDRNIETEEGSVGGNILGNEIETLVKEQDVLSVENDNTDISEDNELDDISGDGRQKSPTPRDPEVACLQPVGDSHVGTVKQTAQDVSDSSPNSLHKRVHCQKVTTVTDSVLKIHQEEILEGQVLKSHTTSEVVITETVLESISLEVEDISLPH